MGSTQQQHRLQTGLFSAKMSVAKWRPRSSGKFLRKEVKKGTFAFQKTKSQFRGILKFKDMIKDTSTTTIKATKTDVYFVFKAKLKTLEEILKRPSESEMAEEAAIDALDEGIKESSMNHQLEMKSLDDYMKRQEVKRKLWRQRFKLNRVRRIKLENDLTELEILELLKKHQDLLRGIRDEEIYSVRHEAYKKGGQNRFMLNEKVFDGVFKDSQVNLVLDEIHKIMGQEGTNEKMLNTDYNFMVLLPEFLIKVN